MNNAKWYSLVFGTSIGLTLLMNVPLNAQVSQQGYGSAETVVQSAPPEPPSPERQAAFHAALEACAAELGIQLQPPVPGQKHDPRMRACMVAKGFSPPAHGPREPSQESSPSNP